MCLNHYLDPSIDFHPKGENSFYWIALDFSEGEPSRDTFAIRFKTADIAQDFRKAVNDALSVASGQKAPAPSSVANRIQASAPVDKVSCISCMDFKCCLNLI